MEKPTTIIEKTSMLKNGKLTETEEILLGFPANKTKALSGEDIFIELRNVGTLTVYVTLLRLANMGLLNGTKVLPTRKFIIY